MRHFRCLELPQGFQHHIGHAVRLTQAAAAPATSAIAIFCNEVKGKSMLALSRDLGLSYKAAFVLCRKMREAMSEEVKAARSVTTAPRQRQMAPISAVTSAPQKEERVDRRLKPKR